MIDMANGKFDPKWSSAFDLSARHWTYTNAVGASFVIGEDEATEAGSVSALSSLLNRKALVAMAPLTGCLA